ncbi:MAG: DNA methyltransferase [Patescibacteria group bacterium]|nr:DNA methyltransferase [Patescibacteria group bacterium]
MNEINNLKVSYVPINQLKPSTYNPRKWSDKATADLKESIKKFGLLKPVICNSAPNRKDVVIGGHFRLKVAKDFGYEEIPVLYINISDIEKEKELNLRLNKNTGEWDLELLGKFDENFLSDIGFHSEELDDIFPIESMPEEFDLEKELRKLDIKKVKVKKGDIYQLGNHKLMCGNSTQKDDVLKLMDGQKADFCFTDPPYRLEYLKTKYKGKAPGFGFRRNRKYLETDVLPDDFTEKWMANISKIQKQDFNIIVFENWKNIREVWGEMEKHWKVRNMIVWNLPNRTQGFAAKYRFFSKHDIAMAGTSGNIDLNMEDEDELLQNEYETALYAIGGRPHWEGYKKGKKICPTDFIQFKADDAKSSGQGVVFGCKPVEILIPYIKVLTKRNNLIIEPFGGSGSTLIASEKMQRRCYLMELSNVYCEVIKRRWERLTGKKTKKIQS